MVPFDNKILKKYDVAWYWKWLSDEVIYSSTDTKKAVRTELHTVLLLATQLVPSLVPEHVNSSTTTLVKCLKDEHIFLKISLRSIKLLFWNIKLLMNYHKCSIWTTC